VNLNEDTLEKGEFVFTSIDVMIKDQG